MRPNAANFADGHHMAEETKSVRNMRIAEILNRSTKDLYMPSVVDTLHRRTAGNAKHGSTQALMRLRSKT